MRTFELDLIHTLLLAMVVLFAGRGLVARVGVLQRFSIPAPVVGGGLVAILLALADGLGGVKLAFNMALKDTLLLMFFTTVGLAADARMLVKGGAKLLLFLGISVVLIVVQNVVGLGAALALDLHPVVGLLGGSITLVGGHGTGAAYAGRLGETMNIQGVMELTMACATAGLVHRRRPRRADRRVPDQAPQAVRARRRRRPKTRPSRRRGGRRRSPRSSLINTLFVVLLCLAGGKALVAADRGDGVHPARLRVLACCSAW